MSGTLQYYPDSVEADGTVRAHYAKTVFVLEPGDFTRATVERLLALRATQGVVVLWGRPAGAQSPEAAVPNAGYGTERGFAWNAAGDGLAHAAFRRPIWLAHANVSAAVRSCALANANRTAYPRYGAVFYTTMSAGTDTPTCLRREKCLPVGGQSVLSSIAPLRQSSTSSSSSEDSSSGSGSSNSNSEKEEGGGGERQTVFATARLDATSFFHDLVPGADAYTSGLVALLAAEIALHDSLGAAGVAALRHDIVFAYFQGEAYGYLGSRAYVHDLAHFACARPAAADPAACDEPYMPATPFLAPRLARTRAVVDAGQVGLLAPAAAADNATVPSTLYAHMTAANDDGDAGATGAAETRPGDAGLRAALEAAAATALPAGLPAVALRVVANATRGLPPSSAMAWARAAPAVPVAVLADHAGAFANGYYHSHHDDAAPVPARLCGVATLLARTLLYAANESRAPTAAGRALAADCALVAELVACLTADLRCPLVTRLLGDLTPAAGDSAVRVAKYVGVYGTSDRRVFVNTYTRIVEGLLRNRTHDAAGPACNASAPCTAPGYRCVGVPPHARCLHAHVAHHRALSPGIRYDRGAWRVTDPREPLYTESYWATLSMALTTVDDPAHDTAVLVAGIVVLVASFAAVYLLDGWLYRAFKLA